MDYTTHFNSALKGRCYFLVIVGQDCKMRWSQNTSAQNQEIVWLKVGDFAQRGAGQREHQFSATGRIRSTDCHVVPPRNDKPHITSRTVSPRNGHYYCNFYEFQLRSSEIN